MADDSSADGSQAAVRAWLGRRGGLFTRVDLLFRQENGGICQNYVGALRRVEVALQEFIRGKALRRIVKLGCPAAGTKSWWRITGRTVRPATGGWCGRLRNRM